jgi:hypothetical protein
VIPLVEVGSSSSSAQSVPKAGIMRNALITNWIKLYA